MNKKLGKYVLAYYPEDGCIYLCVKEDVKGPLIRFRNRRYYKGQAIYSCDDHTVVNNMFCQLTANANVTLHRNLATDNNISLETYESIKDPKDNATATHQKKVDIIIVTGESVANQVMDNTENIYIDATNLSFVTSQENVTLMKEIANESNVENDYTVLASVPFYSDVLDQPPICVTNKNNETESDSIYTEEKNNNSLIHSPSPTFSSSSCLSNEKRKTKQEFCIFCKSLKTHIYRHYQTVHKQEEDVRKFYFLPKGNKERNILIENLRKRGQMEYNTDVDRNTDGLFLSVRRPNKNVHRNRKDYLICPNCRGYYSKHSRRQHVRKCNPNFKGSRAVTILGRKIEGKFHQNASKKMKEIILPVLKDDAISSIVHADRLIIRCGNVWAEKYRNQWEPYMVRQKLRLLGRLFIAVKSKVATVDCLEDIFVPQLFNTVISGVNDVAGFDEDKQIYAAPSTATTFGTLIKKVLKIYMTYLIETQQYEKRKQLKNFIHLWEEEFNNVINRTALENLTEIKNSKQTRLPKTQDIKLLVLYVNKNREEFYNKFLASKTLFNYTQLASYTLIALLVFNRRRAGEMERLTIKSYLTNEEFSPEKNPEIMQTLTKQGQQALNHYVRVVIRGKLGRSVPVIIHKSIKKCVDVLIENRESVGISSSNPYVFGLRSNEAMEHRYIKACYLLRLYSEQCGASEPELLRGTKLRKHIATQATMLHLTDNDIIDLATFMGHKEKIHREHYRLSIGVREVGIISELLEKAQGNCIEETVVSEESLNSTSQPSGNTAQDTITDDSTAYNDQHEQVEDTTTITLNSTCNQASNIEMRSLITNQKTGTSSRKRHSSCSSYKPPSDSDIESQMSDDDDDDTVCPKKHQKVKWGCFITKRRSWMEEEKELVYSAFKDKISCGQSPSLNDIQIFLSKNKEKLHNRSLNTVKGCITNMIAQTKANKRNPDETPKKKRWSQFEQNIIFTEFSNFIQRGKLPSLSACTELKKKYPENFKDRTSASIKTYINNYLRKEKL